MSSDSSSRSSKSASEPPIRFRRIRRDFTELNGDYDQPFAIPDPLYVHTWEKYPQFVEKLVRRAGVPPPHSGEAGPSSRSTSTSTLPSLPYPIEQALAALMAGFDLEQHYTERRMEEINSTLVAYKGTRTKVAELEESAKQIWDCHTNVANGVIAIEQRQDAEIAEIRAELQKLKAKRAKDKEKIKALEIERDEAKKDRVAISAQLELAVQGIEALNGAMVQTQQHVQEMAEEIEALGGEPEEEEAVEGDFFEENDLLDDPMEQEEAEEEPEVIDP